jgi:hypothetical protein
MIEAPPRETFSAADKDFGLARCRADAAEYAIWRF